MSERSFHQISQQYEAKHQEPTVLIRRSNGEIQTAHLTSIKDKHDRRYVEFVDAASGELSYKTVADEGLTDEVQAHLAGELAESANRTPEAYERIQKVEEGLGNAAVEQVVALPEELQHVETASSEKLRLTLKAENIERATAELDRVFGGEIAQILRDAGGDAGERRKAIDPNTGSSELRGRVEDALRAMIDDLGRRQRLPERVQRNSPDNLKNIPSSRFGYEAEKYTSREYAAKLALAIIDGSFDGDPYRRDYDDLPADDPRNGQHRQAARMALEEFAKQKDAQGDDERDLDDESFSHIKRIIRQLAEDDSFERGKFSVHELSDQYYQGLPHVFDPHEVMYQFQDHVQHLRTVGDDIESILGRIHAAVDEVSAQYQADLDRVRMELVNAHAQIENAITIEMMLVHKLDELQYDQNAQLEVRSLFAQQLPLALSSASQAFARIYSIANN